MEYLCVINSDHVVIDNLFFKDYIKINYNVEPKLIEYGGDQLTNNSKHIYFEFLDHDFDISVSRAQEDMNIHVLLDAYTKLPNRNIVIVSNWNTSNYGKKLKNQYKKYSNIFLVDPIYNKEKLNFLRKRAKIYHHSHSLCGTAPSLVEAMYLGLPICSFNVETNKFTTENKAFYYNNSNELIALIKNLKNKDLNENGKNMKEIAKRRYTWKRINKLYKDLIEYS